MCRPLASKLIPVIQKAADNKPKEKVTKLAHGKSGLTSPWNAKKRPNNAPLTPQTRFLNPILPHLIL